MKFYFWIFYENLLPLEEVLRNFISGYFTKLRFHWRDFSEISYLCILRNTASTGRDFHEILFLDILRKSASTGGIFMKFYFWIFYENLLPLEGFS